MPQYMIALEVSIMIKVLYKITGFAVLVCFHPRHVFLTHSLLVCLIVIKRLNHISCH